MLDPVGIDRWPVDLAHKYGMRDGYLCPVGGRWIIGFSSPKPLDCSFTQQARGLLYMAAYGCQCSSNSPGAVGGL